MFNLVFRVIFSVMIAITLSSCGVDLSSQPNCKRGRVVAGTCSGTRDLSIESRKGSSYISILSNATTVTNKNPIEFNFESSIYDQYKYKVIDGKKSCEGGSYSDWFPISSAITKRLAEDGTYKICVLGKSREGKVLKEENAVSQTWTLDTKAPVVILTNTPAELSNSSQLEVRIAEGDSVEYQYKLVSQSEECKGGGYNGTWIPIETPIDNTLDLDGRLRLCVIGRDLAKNRQEFSFATEHNWTKDTIPPHAFLSNVPTNPSKDSSLNAFVLGIDALDYQYKLISQAESCSDNGYNGTWISVETPISETVNLDADYKLCVIARDAAHNSQLVIAATEYSWTKDATPPTALISGAPVLTSSDTALNISVSGTDMTHYRYRVGPGNITCTNTIGYSSEIPQGTNINEDITGLADGSIRLCVMGRDFLGNYQDYEMATEANWIKDTTAPTATLSGTPSDPSSNSNLDVSVGGTGVSSYQYKIISHASSCTGGGYNGSWLPIGSPITDPITADGAYKLCVIGRDTALNGQAEDLATVHIWTKNTPPPVDPSQTVFTQVPVAPVISNGIYQANITLQAKDSSANNILSGGSTVTLSTTGSATLSSVHDNGDGTYSASISNSIAEIVTLSATINGSPIGNTATISFATGSSSRFIGPADQQIRADGVAEALVIFRARDFSGNDIFVGGDDVVMTVNGSANIGPVTDHGDGTYSATITNLTSESVTITPTINGLGVGPYHTSVTFSNSWTSAQNIASSAGVELVGDAIYESVAEDLDGDGYPDVYISNYSETIPNRILWNNQDNTFTVATIPGDIALSRMAKIGDVNGDGRPDIVVANNGANSLWLNQGGRNFIAGTLPSSSALDSDQVHLANLFGNGRLDIYFTTAKIYENYQQNELLRNDGGGNFTLSNIVGDTIPTEGATIGDLDGDGDLDIYNKRDFDFGYKWLNDGSGNFSGPFQVYRSANQGGTYHYVVDMNNDNLPDVITVRNYGLSYFSLNSDNTYTGYSSIWDIGVYLGEVQFADANADGLQDMYLRGSRGYHDRRSVLLVNTGLVDGNGFPIMERGFTIKHYNDTGMAIADFDQDGKVDWFQPSRDGAASYLWLIGKDDADDADLSVSSGSVPADGTSTSTITVTAKNLGVNLTSGGHKVILYASGSATVSSIVDNNDGTYTATITNTRSEIVTISGVIHGHNISSTTTVAFN